MTANMYMMKYFQLRDNAEQIVVTEEIVLGSELNWLQGACPLQNGSPSYSSNTP